MIRRSRNPDRFLPLLVAAIAGILIGYAIGYASAQGDAQSNGFFHECPSVRR